MNQLKCTAGRLHKSADYANSSSRLTLQERRAKYPCTIRTVLAANVGTTASVGEYALQRPTEKKLSQRPVSRHVPNEHR